MGIRKTGLAILVVFSLICTVYSLSLADTSQWLKTYGDVYVDSINRTADGGLVAAGYIQSSDAEPRVACALKLDSNGELQWQKTYTNANAPGSMAVSIQQTRDGGYILAGAVYGNAETTVDAWFVKLDRNGEITWQKAYDRYRLDLPVSVIQTSDNGYVAAVTQLGQSPWFPNSWILKLNPNGGVIWKKRFRGPQDALIKKLYSDSDSHFIANGLLHDPNSGKTKGWFLRFDASGDILWQKILTGRTRGFIADLKKNRDGGYVASGYISQTETERSNALVVKTDNRGQILWQKIYGGFESDSAAVIHQTSDRGYIVSGRTSSFGPRAGAIWVFRLNFSGAMKWQRTYNNFEPHLFPWSDQAADGGYFIALKSNFPFYSQNDPELWLYKTDENGMIANCPIGDVTNARGRAVNIAVQDAHVSTAQMELTPTRIVAATGNFYTQALKASITSSLKSTDRMDKQLLGSMVEGVNAMELDLLAPVNSKAAVSAGKHSAVDFNGIAWMAFNNVAKPGTVFLKLKHGLPAFAKSMQPAWPIFTYELDFKGKIAENGYLDLSFFIGGLNLVDRVSNARLLEWDGQSYRDITTHVDLLRSIIMGRTNRLATYVIMSPISKPIGPTSNQKAKLPYQN